MRPVGALVVASLVFLPGCLHHNVVHNAKRLYADAENDRRAGRHSLAEIRYADVVRKTGEALRARPEGDWGDEALLLMGRSRLRLGELREARVALELLAATAEDSTLRRETEVYLAVLSAELGDSGSALDRVSRALEGPLDGEAQAEAHLLRARLLLASGETDLAWWDLDRAVDANPDVRIEAGIERYRWAVHRTSLKHFVRPR